MSTLAKTRKRKPLSEETKAKIKASTLGRKVSEKTRAKMSKTTTGKPKKPFSKEHKEAIAEARRGKILDEGSMKQLVPSPVKD